MASRKRRSNSGRGVASDEMAEETEEEAEQEEDEIDEADAEDTGGEVSNAADCALGDLAGCILKQAWHVVCDGTMDATNRPQSGTVHMRKGSIGGSPFAIAVHWGHMGPPCENGMELPHAHSRPAAISGEIRTSICGAG